MTNTQQTEPPRKGVLIEMTGQRFGRLTIIGRAPNNGKSGNAFWHCRCDCGGENVVWAPSLRQGKSRSCGCLQSEISAAVHRTHGMCGTTEYNVWTRIIQRCTNPKDTGWKRYGERGISVCDRWRASFADYWADILAEIGPRPPGMELGRKDYDKGFEPGNVRWVARRERMFNARPSSLR